MIPCSVYGGIATGTSSRYGFSALVLFLDGDYLIIPDIVVCRHPEPDVTLNTLAKGKGPFVDAADDVARLCPLRKCNHKDAATSIMHASISCKWTIRSDRGQNTKTEALNLVRNRKGRLPHVVVVTAEPMPSRLASVALGTGDIDCTYHIALPELQASMPEDSDAEEMLKILVEGRRLRDISDLPLDLMA